MKISSIQGGFEVNSNGLYWHHLEDATQLKELSKEHSIPLSVLQEAIDEQEKPRVYPLEHFLVVVYKIPYDIKDTASTISIAFFVNKKGIVSVCSKKLEFIHELHNKELFQDYFKKNSVYLLYKILDHVNNQYFKHIDALEESLTAVEKLMFNSQSKNTMKKLYNIKKTIIYYHRSLNNNREVANALEKGQNLSTTEAKLYRIVYDDTVQMIDMISTYREIITSNMEIYLTITNNNLNQVMKRLTAGASLVLVPTFITGLYGMNFTFMPEITWRYGYLFAWVLIIISVILLWYYFKKKEYF